MKYTLKTRLIGAALLAAIALIFLPSFFKDKQVAPVSTKTQIPPKPSIKSEEFKAPQPVASVEPASPPETMFMSEQPSEESSSAAHVETIDSQAPVASIAAQNLAKETQARSSISSAAKITKQNASVVAATPTAHLNERGLPEAWMVQVGGFATKEAADKIRDQLQTQGLKAFDRKVTNIKGVAAKVFVGPVLEKGQAATIKSQIDRELKVNSMIVKFQP